MQWQQAKLLLSQSTCIMLTSKLHSCTCIYIHIFKFTVIIALIIIIVVDVQNKVTWYLFNFGGNFAVGRSTERCPEAHDREKQSTTENCWMTRITVTVSYTHCSSGSELIKLSVFLRGVIIDDFASGPPPKKPREIDSSVKNRAKNSQMKSTAVEEVPKKPARSDL